MEEHEGILGGLGKTLGYSRQNMRVFVGGLGKTLVYSRQNMRVF